METVQQYGKTFSMYLIFGLQVDGPITGRAYKWRGGYKRQFPVYNIYYACMIYVCNLLNYCKLRLGIKKFDHPIYRENGSLYQENPQNQFQHYIPSYPELLG